MNIKKFLVGTAVGTLMFGVVAVSAFAANSTIVVTPGDMATSIADVVVNPTSWFFYNDETDTIDNSLGLFVVGPATPPLGTDSVQVSVTGTQRRNLATYQFSGTPLADITELKFSTYNPSLGNGGSVNRSGYLNFNVDFNGSDTWQRRLVYVPSQNGTVVQNNWQEWDTINGGSAEWSYSGATWPLTLVGPDASLVEPGTTLRSWSDILADYPGVRVRVTDSWLGVRVGEPYADGYTENIDKFVFGTAAGVKTFDFDLVNEVGPPTLFSECKGEGWKTFNNPTFTKKSQCEKYVKDHQHSIKGENVIYTAGGLKREADMRMTTGENAGYFEYEDAAKGWYNVKVSSVKVDGNLGWFAGRVVKASNPAWVGLWIFAKVEDGTPDKIWGSFTDETSALNGVATMGTPVDGPFTVTKKNIKVQ